jgi:hypothetical protein
MLEKLRPQVWTLLVLWICVPLAAQTTKDVSFKRDVVPILSEKCLKCHGLASPMANLDLKSREGALKGGQHGPALIPEIRREQSLQTRLRSGTATDAASGKLPKLRSRR